MKLVFATHNQNKLQEIQSLLPQNIELLSLSDIGCTEDIAETSETIDGNALQKAHYVKEKYGYDCFADDTGLEVEALNGAPGVYSARYAGAEKSDAANVEKLLTNLKTESNRAARFKTVIALCLQEKEYLFEGICEGTIIREKRGSAGFGYDPVFVPLDQPHTFAEMELSEKNKLGHRGKAVRALLDFLTNKN